MASAGRTTKGGGAVGGFGAEFGAGMVFGRALLWAAFSAGLVATVALFVELILVDFVHGNSDRSQSNAIAMMLFLSPIIGAIIAIWTLVVLGPSQAFQAVAMPMLVRVCRTRPEFGALFMLPAAVALAWYCFDYLTPGV